MISRDDFNDISLQVAQELVWSRAILYIKLVAAQPALQLPQRFNIATEFQKSCKTPCPGPLTTVHDQDNVLLHFSRKNQSFGHVINKKLLLTCITIRVDVLVVCSPSLCINVPSTG